eukprot:6192416-Pleurochrysis_carterae.AAC.3
MQVLVWVRLVWAQVRAPQAQLARGLRPRRKRLHTRLQSRYAKLRGNLDLEWERGIRERFEARSGVVLVARRVEALLLVV